MNAWETHRDVLKQYLAIANGAVVELGAGAASTPLFQEYARRTGHEVFTLDSDADWLALHMTGAPDNHDSTWVRDWGDALDILSTEPFALAFVDCAPGTARPDIIEALRAGGTDIVIVHDTEDATAEYYGWGSSLDGWGQRWDFFVPGMTQRTTVLVKRKLDDE